MGPGGDGCGDAAEQKSLELIGQSGRAQKDAVSPPIFGKFDQDLFGIADRDARVYSGKLQIPYDAFGAGIGDHRIVTTLCPGGKERMRRLMEIVRHGRVDPPLLTHRFSLNDSRRPMRFLVSGARAS